MHFSRVTKNKNTDHKINYIIMEDLTIFSKYNKVTNYRSNVDNKGHMDT